MTEFLMFANALLAFVGGALLFLRYRRHGFWVRLLGVAALTYIGGFYVFSALFYIPPTATYLRPILMILLAYIVAERIYERN